MGIDLALGRHQLGDIGLEVALDILEDTGSLEVGTTEEVLDSQLVGISNLGPIAAGVGSNLEEVLGTLGVASIDTRAWVELGQIATVASSLVVVSKLVIRSQRQLKHALQVLHVKRGCI